MASPGDTETFPNCACCGGSSSSSSSSSSSGGSSGGNVGSCDAVGYRCTTTRSSYSLSVTGGLTNDFCNNCAALVTSTLSLLAPSDPCYSAGDTSKTCWYFSPDNTLNCSGNGTHYRWMMRIQLFAGVYTYTLNLTSTVGCNAPVNGSWTGTASDCSGATLHGAFGAPVLCDGGSTIMIS